MTAREHEPTNLRSAAESSSAEDALRDRISRLESIIDASSMGTFEWNVQSGRIICNERYAEILGYSLTELEPFSADAWLSLAHPGDLAECTRQLQKHFDGAVEHYDCECRMRRKDGSWVWVVARGRVCSRTTDGKPLMMLGTQYDISARKCAEESARLAQQQREAAQRRRDELVASVDGIVWEADAETFRFTFVSAQAERLLGHPIARWLSEPTFWIDHIHPDDRVGAVQYCVSCTRELRDHRFDYRMRAADGRYVWLQDVVTVVAKDGCPTELRGIMVDITARKQAEDALRQSEAFLATIYRNADVGIFLVEVSEDGGFTFSGVNPAHERLLGLPSAQIIGKSPKALLSHIGQRGVAYVEALYAQCIRERATLESEFYVPEGPAQGWWFSRLTPLFSSDGSRVLRLIGTSLPIDSRKRAEEALRESEERLRLAVQASNVGLWDWELGTNRVSYSREWKAQLGYEEHEIENEFSEWEARVHPDDLHAALAKVQSYLAEPKAPHENEFRMRHKTGAWRWIYARAEVVRDAEGRPLRMMGCHVDVTERRQLEERLQHAQRMEAIGQLAGGVAHDFNNLLTVIHGSAAMLREDMNRGVALHAEPLSELTRAAERAAALTRQLLTFSRRQRLEARPLDLNAVVQNLFSMLQRLIGEDVRLRLELDAAPLVVVADPGLLEQMLVNLAVNARDAMPGGGELRVETSRQQLAASELQQPEAKAGPHARLSVIDSGTGIAPEHLPHIFEPFFTTKEVGKGTGLGLATVFGIVHQHGGWVQVTSELSQGTRFDILLPLADDGASIRPPAHSGAPAEQRRQPGTESILLVEDEEPVRRLVHRLLSRAGYRVLTAASGEEALQLLERQGHEVDLVLTDLIMPGGVSGQELGRRLCERNARLRILYMSGYTGDSGASDAPDRFRLPPGARLLAKPFTPATLLESVRTSLSGS
jgi:PAS domain S-box-containing protein